MKLSKHHFVNMTYTFKGTGLSALVQEHPLTVEALFVFWRVLMAPLNANKTSVSLS